jgi:DnaK suppressor protein
VPKNIRKGIAERIKRPYTARLFIVNGYLQERESMTISLPDGYKPSPDEDYMSPQQLEYFRKKLLDWRAELLQESENTISHLKEENWQEPDINDRASLETDAALELRTRDRYRKLVNKIDSALSRVADGTYGYCADTGEEIGLFRLEARPIATLTVEAQEKHERLEKQRRDD